MDFLNSLGDYVVPFLFVLTALVFVHELGHYLLARRNRVRVEVFSIGFGPEIRGWTDGAGTRWKISAVPLGGYVKMFGEDGMWDEEGKEKPLSDEERAAAFPHKRLGQRAAIVAAGPIANFIFAIILLAGLFNIVGNPLPLSAIGMVQPGSAAEEAGIRVGDMILSINGEPIELFYDLRRIVSGYPGVPLKLIIRRDGAESVIAATPKRHKRTGENGVESEVGLLGVAPDPNHVKYERQGPLDATWMAMEKSYEITMQTLVALGEIVTGERNSDELGGPLRIAQISGEMAQGGMANLVFFMAALSLNLGLINLFPIPMLDGGHLVFYLAEFVLGRPVSPRLQEYGFRFGLILVLLLMVFATWNDLVHLKVFEFLKQLIV